MARKVKSEVMKVWWVHALLALSFLALSYGFASLAIDSGSLLQYAVCIALAYLGIASLFRAVRRAR